jgi:hypothetical protein
MKLTGHKTEGVYRRYAISSKCDLEEAVRRFDSSLNQRNIEKFVYILANN